MADFTGQDWPIGYYTTPGEGGDAVGVDWLFNETFLNRTWYTPGSRFVFWTTTENPDPTGYRYPGPGTFGVDTTGYTFIAPFAG